MTKVASPRQAYTLFCEDIRQDVLGGFSAIGIRPAELAIEANEVALPKFVVLTVLDLPSSESEQAMRIALLESGKTMVETDFVIPAQPKREQEQRLVLTMPIQAAPFQAKVGMKLSVRVTGPDLNYRSHTLAVVLTSEFDQPQAIASDLRAGETLPSAIPEDPPQQTTTTRKRATVPRQARKR